MNARFNPDRGNEQGAVLLIVTFVGFMAILLAAGLVQHFAFREARAIDASLAKVRAYWAMQGHVDFLLSRSRHQETEVCTGGDRTNNGDDGDCTSIATDLQLATTMTSYMDEIDNPDGTSTRLWSYAEVSPSYNFIRDDPDTTGADARLILTVDFQQASGDLAPVLSDLGSDVRDLNVKFCLVDAYGDNCGATLDANLTGISRISAMERCYLNAANDPDTCDISPP
jgi:hypothetical protein